MPRIPGFGGGGEAATPSPITKDQYGQDVIDATRISEVPQKPGMMDRIKGLGRKKKIEEAERATPDDPNTPGDESLEAGLRAASEGSEGAESPYEGHPENWGPIGSNVAAESGQMASDEAARRIATGANPDAVRIPGAPAGNNRLVVDEAVAPGVDLDARNEREVQDAIAKLQAGADWEEVTSVLPSNLYGEVFDRIEQGQDERSTGAGHNLKVGPDGLPVMTMRDFFRPDKDFGNLRPENGGVLPKESASPTVFAAEPKAPTEQAVGTRDQVVASGGMVVAPESGSARPDEAGTEAASPTIPPPPEEPPARSAPDEPPEGHNQLAQGGAERVVVDATSAEPPQPPITEPIPAQVLAGAGPIVPGLGLGKMRDQRPGAEHGVSGDAGQPPKGPEDGGGSTTTPLSSADAEYRGGSLVNAQGEAKPAFPPGMEGQINLMADRIVAGEKPELVLGYFDPAQQAEIMRVVEQRRASEPSAQPGGGTLEPPHNEPGAEPRPATGGTDKREGVGGQGTQPGTENLENSGGAAPRTGGVTAGETTPGTQAGSAPGGQVEQEAQDEEPELRAFRDQYKDSSMELLTSEIQDIDRRAAEIRTGIRPEKGVQLDSTFVAGEVDKLKILEKQRGVLAGLRRGKIAEQSTSSTREQEHQARQEARTEYETIKAYSGKSAGELKAEIDSMRTGITGLEERRDSAYARGDYRTAKAMEEELDRAVARLKSAESIRSTKEATDKEKGKKEAKKTAKAQDKKNEEAMEATRRAAMTTVQLQSEIRLLGKDANGNIISGSELDRLDKKVKGFEDRLRKGEKLSRSEREDLSRARADYIRLTNQIGDYDNALKAAKEKAATKSGLKDAESLEDLDDVSKKQYRAMTKDQRSDRLTDIIRVLPAGTEGKTILDSAFKKMSSGENLSQVELAMYAREMGDKWIAGKNRKGLIKDIQPAITKYPELKKTMLDLIEASKAIDEFRKTNPSRWEKMKGVGKDHKGLFMLLLILLGGAIVGSMGKFKANER